MTSPAAPLLALDDLLTISDLRVRIGRVDVLTSASLRVAAGAAVGLVGETGSGKTMTVRAAAGLLGRVRGRVAGGTVAVAGNDLTHATERTWRRFQGRTVALVPQSSMSSLDPLMRIGRQLRETIRVLDPAADTAAEASRLLQSVHLPAEDRLLRAYPHELSGGMRQRVMIALALSGGPELLVADEPTTALDAAIQAEILELLGELRRTHRLGLLLVSHDLGVIETTTDTTVVMYGGRTVESGPTPDVLASPAHPYTRALLDARPGSAPPGQPLRTIPGRPPAPGEIRSGCPFAPRCPQAWAACTSSSPPLVTVAPDRRTACFLYDQEDAA